MKNKRNFIHRFLSICLLIVSIFISCYKGSIRCDLTFRVQGYGSTDPTGTVVVYEGEPFDISAIPAEGNRFIDWEVISGSNVEFGNQDEADTTVTLNSGNAVIQANFGDASAPSGYTMSIDQPYITETNESGLSFTFSNAETGGTYYYSIDDPDNESTDPVTGSGAITQTTETIPGIDVSVLDDSILTLEFYISDAEGNDGEVVSDTVVKDTETPSFVSVDHDGDDDVYATGEVILFTVTMGESGLTVTADLSVLDSTFSATQEFTDNGDNTYIFSTSPLNSNTMNEGTVITVTFSASDTVGHITTNNSLSLQLVKTRVFNEPSISLLGATLNEGFTINNSNKILFAFERILTSNDSEINLSLPTGYCTFTMTKDGSDCGVDNENECSGSYLYIAATNPGGILIMDLGETPGTAFFNTTVEANAAVPIVSCDWQLTLIADTNADIQYARAIPEITITYPAEVQSGQQGVIVTGSGTPLFEPDSLSPAPVIISYAWIQAGGPSVVLSGDTTSMLTFDAPVVATDTDLTFQLEVSDDVDLIWNTGDELTADLTVVITVKALAK